MSDSVKDIEKLTNRQIETVKKRQSHQIKSMERAHDQVKVELKKGHENDIVEIQDQNLRSVNAEAEKKEKILIEMQNNLNHTKHMTDKQLVALKEDMTKTRSEEHNKLAVDRDRIQAENELHLEDLNHRYNTQTQKIAADGKDRIQTISQAKAEEFAHTEGHFSKKLNDQTQDFNTRFTTDTNSYRKMKDDQDGAFKKERMGTNYRQQVEVAKLVSSHNDIIENRDVEFQKGIKQQDQFFEQKYNATLKTQNEAFKGLDDRHKEVVTKMKNNLTSELTSAIKRSDDPFFQFAELRPAMEQFPDRVEVSVAVPEHSKQDLQLTTNGKEAILSFNRRHDDVNSPQTGVTNKLHKVESYTTRLKTNQMLDPKSVKADYVNGVMTYIIKHA